MATKFTFYPAATDIHPNKPGVNRIQWDDHDKPAPEGWENLPAEEPANWGWTEVTREYLPEDPRNT